MKNLARTLVGEIQCGLTIHASVRPMKIAAIALWVLISILLALVVLPKHTRQASSLGLVLGGSVIAAMAAFFGYYVLDAITNEAIRCIGRRCDGLIFTPSNQPVSFWSTLGFYFTGASFSSGVALNCLLRLFGLIRHKA